MQQLQVFNSALETMAAIGAELRLRREKLSGDPRVLLLLQDVMRTIDPGLFDGLTPNQEQAALALIQTSFRQAADLLENPERTPGWIYDDPVVLQSQGQLSRLIVRGIKAAAAQRPDIGSTLKEPSTFLDVGTGVGWLAIEAAQSWPAWRVVGIDSWKPALDLAQKNLTQSSVAEQVEFRLQRVEELNDEARFALAWLPAQFIAADVIPMALESVYCDLTPGVWLIVGVYPPPPDELGQVLTKLRIVRSGGHPWTTDEIEEQLRALGFDGIEAFSPMPPVLFLLGRRPAAAG